MIRFSVVIPAYQSAASIIAALHSVQQQRYAAFEIIVVDDAGNDDLNTSLLRSGVPHALVRHAVNRGVSAARNTGWDMASGDYVAFLDSDDRWCATKLEQMAALLVQQPDAALLGHAFSTESCTDTLPIPHARRVCLGDFVWRNRFQGSSIVCKRQIPFRFEAGMRYSEDFDLALQICAAGLPVYYTPVAYTILGRPQQASGGLSASRWNMRLGELRAYTRLGRARPEWICFVPFLWIFSLLKHLRSLFRP